MRRCALTSRKWRIALWFVCCGIAAGAHGGTDEAYRVRFRGLPARSLRADLEAASDAFSLRAHRPPGEGLLLQRGERDLPRLRDVLKAEGYYAATVAVSLEAAGPGRGLVFTVDPGPRYRVGDIALVAEPARAPPLRAIELAHGQFAHAGDLLAAEERLLQQVRRQGYPFPRLATREYRADPERALVHVRLVVDPGAPARFGGTTIRGLSRLHEGFVRNELDWREGQPYDPARLDDAQTRLMRSALFASVRLATPDRVADDGTLPVELDLAERRRRTVALGVNYRTDEGAGAGGHWEHRNLFGGAERVRVEAAWAERLRSAETSLRKPQFLGPAHDLVLALRASEEDTDAYESRYVRASGVIEREWNRDWMTSLGVAFRDSAVDQLDEREDFTLASVPARVDWDTTDDPLDPRRGHRLLADATAFYDLRSRDLAFVKTRATGHRYLRLNRDRSWLLAGRASVGAIMGAGQTAVPADERFYAGGGSSIRGYAYQSVGPLEGEDPLGGRSLVEVSLELRGRLGRDFGCVAFVDGGTAYEAAVPDFDEELLWGAGIGLRYFTPVGPLRADVGFPLDRRPDLDRSFQVYVSLGQAF